MEKQSILEIITAGAERCEMAFEEVEDILERYQYARTTPRDVRLERFYDNELVDEIEKRGYPVGRKDIITSIILRDMADME